jgi:hypothetical protein
VAKLTQNQITTLVNLYEDEAWEDNTCKASKKTLNSLLLKGLVKIVLYAGGYRWEMTDKGIDELNAVRPL